MKKEEREKEGERRLKKLAKTPMNSHTTLAGISCVTHSTHGKPTWDVGRNNIGLCNPVVSTRGRVFRIPHATEIKGPVRNPSLWYCDYEGRD